jgi:TM2 domain-containing membrane protein YozV
MVAAARQTDNHAAMDAALNLLWPGLGQFSQGRTVAGGYFAVEALALVVVFGVWPAVRALAGILIVALTLWSILDVLAAARRSSTV